MNAAVIGAGIAGLLIADKPSRYQPIRFAGIALSHGMVSLSSRAPGEHTWSAMAMLRSTCA